MNDAYQQITYRVISRKLAIARVRRFFRISSPWNADLWLIQFQFFQKNVYNQFIHHLCKEKVIRFPVIIGFC